MEKQQTFERFMKTAETDVSIMASISNMLNYDECLELHGTC